MEEHLYEVVSWNKSLDTACLLTSPRAATLLIKRYIDVAEAATLLINAHYTDKKINVHYTDIARIMDVNCRFV